MRDRRQPALPTSKFWARTAFISATVGPVLQLVVAPRSVTILGASTAPSRLGSLVGQATNLVVVVALFAVLVQRRDERFTHGRALLWGVWAMAGALFIGGLFSPMPSTARYLIFFALTLGLISIGFGDDWRGAARLARLIGRVFVAGSLIAAAIAPSWAFIAQGYNAYTSQYLGYDRTIFGIPRLVGLSPHPTVLAIIATTALALELAFREGRRVVNRGFTTAAALCVVLTQTTTAYLAVSVALLVLLIVRHRSFRVLAFLGVIGLSIVVWFVPAALAPSDLTSSQYVTTFSGRTLIWDYAVAEWHRHVWWGYGPNMWSDAYLSLNLPPQLRAATNAHSQFFQTLSDSGLVGIAALSVVVVSLLRCAASAVRVDAGLSAALAAVLIVNGVTEATLRTIGVLTFPALTVLTIALTAARAAYPCALAARPLATSAVHHRVPTSSSSV